MCGAKRWLWALGTLAALCCGTRAPASVTLAINPATTMTTLGTNFNVAIEVQAGTQQVDGASAHIDFDPSILQVVSITAGSALPLRLGNTFSNAAGTVDYSAGIFSGFPSGTFTLATVTFNSIAASAGTPLAFHTAPPRQSYATFGGSSVLTGTVPGDVVVTAPATGQVRLMDYFYPAQTGATWLYQGPGQVGSPRYTTHTRVRMANTNYPLTLYNPTAYIQNVLVLDEDYGYLSGTTFISTDNWKEYWAIANGLATYGDDDPAESPDDTPESLRVTMTPFPVDMTVGQSATRQGPVYDGAGRFLGNASLTMQLIERTAVTVPAGTFADCVHLRFTLTLDGSPQVQDVWWALGVGQVRRTRISGYEPDENNGGYLQELASYTIPVTPKPTATVTPSPTPPPSTCVGNCDGGGDVTVNELIQMVNIALGNANVTACTAGDANGDGEIAINEIVAGVNNALNGCGG